MYFYYLCRRLASGEGIVSLGVCLSRCRAVCVSAAVVGGEGKALYPMLSSLFIRSRRGSKPATGSREARKIILQI